MQTKRVYMVINVNDDVVKENLKEIFEKKDISPKELIFDVLWIYISNQKVFETKEDALEYMKHSPIGEENYTWIPIDINKEFRIDKDYGYDDLPENLKEEYLKKENELLGDPDDPKYWDKEINKTEDERNKELLEFDEYNKELFNKICKK